MSKTVELSYLKIDNFKLKNYFDNFCFLISYFFPNNYFYILANNQFFKNCIVGFSFIKIFIFNKFLKFNFCFNFRK